MSEANVRRGRVWITFTQECLGHHHSHGITTSTRKRMDDAHEKVKVREVRRLRDKPFDYEVKLQVNTVDNGDKIAARLNERVLIEEWVLRLKKQPCIVADSQIK